MSGPECATCQGRFLAGTRWNQLHTHTRIKGKRALVNNQLSQIYQGTSPNRNHAVFNYSQESPWAETTNRSERSCTICGNKLFRSHQPG